MLKKKIGIVVISLVMFLVLSQLIIATYSSEISMLKIFAFYNYNEEKINNQTDNINGKPNLVGAVLGSSSGPLTVHPTNPRYFADKNGNAVYLTGSHSHTVFQDWYDSSGEFDVDRYIDFLKLNNHNFAKG